LREKLIDFVAVDLKSPFDDFSFERTTRSQNFFRTSSGVVSNLKETFKLLKESNVDVEVRTTIIPEFMFTEYDLLQLASIVDESKFRWVFQSFISENKELVDKRFKAMGSPTEQLMNSLKEACINKHPQLLIEIK
jgi:pyruvate-formate lyase-activating enzyme